MHTACKVQKKRLVIARKNLIFLHLCPQSGQSAVFFSSRWNWDAPTPSPAGECDPLPPFGTGGATRWRHGPGVGGVPIPTRDMCFFCVGLAISAKKIILRKTE
jgi:hypothetical protein